MLESRFDLEWCHQVRIYRLEEAITCRIVSLRPDGHYFLTPHMRIDLDRLDSDVEPGTPCIDLRYGAWRLYDMTSIIKLDLHDQRMGMKVFTAFTQALHKVRFP